METIRVVLDSELLRAANGAAKRARVNRSALIRRALREHLKRLKTRDLEILDRRGAMGSIHRMLERLRTGRAAAWPEQ